MSLSSTSHFVGVNHDFWHSLVNFRRQGTHWANSATFFRSWHAMTSFQLRSYHNPVINFPSLKKFARTGGYGPVTWSSNKCNISLPTSEQNGEWSSLLNRTEDDVHCSQVYWDTLFWFRRSVRDLLVSSREGDAPTWRHKNSLYICRPSLVSC